MTVIPREKIDQRDTKDPSDVVYLWSQRTPGIGKGIQGPKEAEGYTHMTVIPGETIDPRNPRDVDIPLVPGDHRDPSDVNVLEVPGNHRDIPPIL